MICKKCGNQLSKEDSICIKCGEIVEGRKNGSKKIVIGILIAVIAVVAVAGFFFLRGAETDKKHAIVDQEKNDISANELMDNSAFQEISKEECEKNMGWCQK